MKTDLKLANLSIVLPCHNEEEIIQHSYSVLKDLLIKWQDNIISDYEVVMVNNGSTDHTFEKMMELYKKDPEHVVVVDLRNNYGYQGSITAGLHNAKMEMVVTIDADLQDDPTKIEEMIHKYYEGYEMVLGIRSSRKSDSFFKKHLSQGFYKIMNLMGVRSVYNHGDFRLLSHKLVEEFKQMSERNRYIRGMILELESKYACVYYERVKRQMGDTKFSPMKLLSFAVQGITSTSNFPIRFVFGLGMTMFILSLVGIAYVISLKLFFDVQSPGWASLLVIIMFFSGIQNLGVGIIGEYLSKMYMEVKKRPVYIVRNRYDQNSKREESRKNMVYM